MTMEVSVTDLKKLAAECWRLSDQFGYSCDRDDLAKVAVALDAYAGAQESAPCQKHGAIVETGCQMCERALSADAQEPVAWRYKTKGIGDWWHPISTKHGWLNDTRHEIEPLYAAPPPAKPASDAVREALELAHGRLHAKGFLQAAGVVFDLKYELLGEQP